MDCCIQTKKRIDLLDLLKAIGILCVIVTHCDFTRRNIKANSLFFCLVLDLAVPLFMIISGYNYGNSVVRQEEKTLKGLYSKTRVVKQLERILPSYIVIFMVEIVFYHFSDSSLDTILLYFLSGGKGPGSYYVPIMVQFILVVPLCFEVIRKYKKRGLYAIATINMLFECLVYLVPIPAPLYRLLIFRYLFIIGMGIYISISDNMFTKKELYCSFVIGVGYIFFTNYFKSDTGEYVWSLFKYWQNTAAPVGLYIFPIFSALLKKFKFYVVKLKKILLIGKASWHIFLIQVLYYQFFYGGLNLKNILYHFPIGIEIIINLIICILLGVFFFEIECNIKNKLRGKYSET